MSSRPSSGVLNVNIASLCDWTTVSTDYINNIKSVNTFFRNRDFLRSITSMSYPVAEPGSKRTYLRPWFNSNERSLATGRMFLKEKMTLTKGEREIIAGICQNRGDFNQNEKFRGSVDGKRLLSHRDAWLIGKQPPRAHPLVRLDDSVSSSARSEPEASGSTTPTSGHATHECGCFSCNPVQCLCRDCLTSASLSLEGLEGHKFGERPESAEYITAMPAAPPTTPEHSWVHKPKVPPINSSLGTVQVKQIVHKNTRNSGGNKKRTVLDVYLPRLDSNAQECNDTCEHTGITSPPESARASHDIPRTSISSQRARVSQREVSSPRVGHITTRIQLTLRRGPSRSGHVVSAPSLYRQNEHGSEDNYEQFVKSRPPSAVF